MHKLFKDNGICSNGIKINELAFGENSTDFQQKFFKWNSLEDTKSMANNKYVKENI